MAHALFLTVIYFVNGLVRRMGDWMVQELSLSEECRVGRSGVFQVFEGGLADLSSSSKCENIRPIISGGSAQQIVPLDPVWPAWDIVLNFPADMNSVSNNCSD